MSGNGPETLECTYIHKLKDNVEEIPVTESMFGPALLVCPGDKDYPFKNSSKNSSAHLESGKKKKKKGVLSNLQLDG